MPLLSVVQWNKVTCGRCGDVGGTPPARHPATHLGQSSQCRTSRVKEWTSWCEEKAFLLKPLGGKAACPQVEEGS